MCLSVFLCPCVTLSQLYQRISPQTFRPLLAWLALLFGTTYVLLIVNAVRAGNTRSPAMAGTWEATVTIIVQLLMLAVFVKATWIVCTVRSAVRARDAISTGGCGSSEDCCVSFWCNPCTQCQIFSHLGLGGDKYTIFSETGEKGGSEASKLTGPGAV